MRGHKVFTACQVKMTNYETIKSTRGKDVILFDGYTYGIDRTSSIARYFKCTHRRPVLCPGRGKIDHDSQEFVPNQGNHNHAREPEKIERSKTMTLAKDEVKKNPTASLKASYTKVARARQEALGNIADPISIPTLESVRTVLRYQVRKELQHPVPQSLEEVNVADNEFVFQDGNIIMMVAPKMLELLGDPNTDCIYGDGTFYIAPRHFHQLYTLHVMRGDAMFCCALFCLPGKTEDIYRKMWAMLLQKVIIHCKRFQLDFEVAAINAVQHMFPMAQVSGCFFHYTQCIWRKVQQLGLSSDYGRISEITTMVRRFAALPLLKGIGQEEDVTTAFHTAAFFVVSETLTDLQKTKMNQLIKYVHDTWVGPTARFNVKLWTRHDIKGPRTNNHLEWWHNSMNKKTGAHVNIHAFIAAIRLEQADNEVRLMQVTKGAQDNHKKRKYLQSEKIVKRLIDAYKNGSDMHQFLDEVSKHLKFQAPIQVTLE